MIENRGFMCEEFIHYYLGSCLTISTRDILRILPLQGQQFDCLVDIRYSPSPVKCNFQNHVVSLFEDVDAPLVRENVDANSCTPCQASIIGADPNSEEGYCYADLVAAENHIAGDLRRY